MTDRVLSLPTSHDLPPVGPSVRRPAVAILGFTDHRTLAPFDDPRFEVWGLNELYRYMDPAKFTRWFEIHPRSWFEKDDPAHIEGLAKLTIPVYMQDHYDDIPPSVRFPKEAVEAAAGTYMTSSIAWMIGLALAEGFEEIHVYGVDMAQDTEYAEQRPCCEFLLGLAQGRGIKTYLPPTSDLLSAVGQYAFMESGDKFSQKLDERMTWLQRELTNFQQKGQALDAEYNTKSGGLKAEYEQKRDMLVHNIRQIEGALDDCRYWKRSWSVQGRQSGKNATPDRALDLKTGIGPTAAEPQAAN